MRRVAIVGFCKTTRDMVNRYVEQYLDAEVWSLNNAYVFLRVQATRWFEMHNPGLYEWEMRRPKGHVGWLKAFPGPVYLHEPRPEVPNGVAFPLDVIAADLGECVYKIADDHARRDTRREPYLTSSIGYMFALAIHERFDEIAVFGIDLNTQGEYAWQKPNAEFLLGLAAGRGLNIVIPDNCALLKGNLYGRGYLAPEGERMSKEQLEARVDALQQQRQAASERLYHLVGAKKEAAYIIQNAMAPGVQRKEWEKRLGEFDRLIAEAQSALHRAEGAIQETLFWIQQTPDGMDPAKALPPFDGVTSSGDAHIVVPLERPDPMDLHIETAMLKPSENGMLVPAAAREAG